MNVEIRRLHPGDDALVMQGGGEVFDEPQFVIMPRSKSEDLG
ncbi:hypothetical protein [Mesorhizobium atlanticum]|nr:hypothetical protein [Mesorhizobium atlanticum]